MSDSETKSAEISSEENQQALDDLVEQAEAEEKEASPLITFDTFGTTAGLNPVEFNKAFLDYAADHYEELGYTREQVAAWQEKFRENPNFYKKDPEYLRESARGKVAIVQNGIYPITFYPDVIDFFVSAAEKGIKLATTSKGGIELIEAIYSQELKAPVAIGDRTYKSYMDFLDGIKSTSAKGNRFPDKTKPECYLEQVLRQYINEGNKTLSYTSDDSAEVNAALQCSERLKRMKNPHLKNGIAAIHIPPDIHSKGDHRVTLQNGIYIIHDLSEVIAISQNYAR